MCHYDTSAKNLTISYHLVSTCFSVSKEYTVPISCLYWALNCLFNVCSAITLVEGSVEINHNLHH